VLADTNLGPARAGPQDDSGRPGSVFRLEPDPLVQDAARGLGKVGDVEVGVVQLRDRPAETTQHAVKPHQTLAKRPLGRGLHPAVQRRLHLKTPFVHALLAVRSVQVAPNPLRQVGGNELRLLLPDDAQRLACRAGCFLLREDAAFAKHAEEGVAPGPYDVRPEIRRPDARARKNRDERCGLGMVEVGRGLAEVVAGRRLDAVVVVPEVRQVAVVHQDLLLAELLLELDREQGLPDLPAPELRSIEEEHPRRLHRDRGGAGEELAALPVLHDGPEHADDVETAMGVEVPVLRGEQDAGERLRHFVFGEQDPGFDRVVPEGRALVVAQAGDLTGRQVSEGLDLGKVDRSGNTDAQEHTDHRRERNRQEPAPAPDAPCPRQFQGIPRRLHCPRIIRLIR